MLTPSGAALWASGPCEESALALAIAAQPSGLASRAELGPGRYACSVPVKASEKAWLILCILVDTLRPAPLDDVFRLAAPVLQCLERQFAVYAALATQTRVAAELTPQLRLTRAVNELEPRESLAGSLAALAGLCREGLSCEQTAILLPGSEMILVDPPQATPDQSQKGLLDRLLAREDERPNQHRLAIGGR